MIASRTSTLEMLPQIASITSLRSDGSLVLKKTVREYLGLSPGAALGVQIGDEVWLTSSPDSTEDVAPLAVDRRGRVELPSEALVALGPSESSKVALVQRPGAVAVKWVSLEVIEGQCAHYRDIETLTSITRRVEANPMPGTALPDLIAQAAGLRLKFGVAGYLKGRPGYHAWCARQALGMPDPDDVSLCGEMIDARLVEQRNDGSWGPGEGSLFQTARMLRELAELGIHGDHPDVQRAVAWLLGRPASAYNPGQWFGLDALVDEQARVVEARAAIKHGTRPRFRQLRSSELGRVRGADDLVVNPCGPRIMWPSALVLDALLRQGYEDAPRVQEALGFMLTQDWCECGYQNGTFGRRECPSFSGERLAAFESECIDQYRYAGLHDPEEILNRDMSHKPVRFERCTVDATPVGRVYTLKIDHHIQGCEFITTRALALVKDRDVRRFAEAHLWRFAGHQLPAGTFSPERHGTGFGHVGILETFSRYPDHPISQVAILRALPWLVETQRDDGAWIGPPSGSGDADQRADAITCAVVKVLNAVRRYLPRGFWDGGRLPS